MKRCPECRRDYFDETLKFCLDDGTPLVDGPRSDGDVTRILPERISEPSAGAGRQNAAAVILPASGRSERNSRRTFLILAGTLLAVTVVGVYAYLNTSRESSKAESQNAAAITPAKLYWEMGEEEKSSFIRERAKYVQTLIGDEPVEFDDAAIKAIRDEIEDYVDDRDSLSQKPFEEGLRAIFGRATQFVPTVIRAFDEQKVPAALGIYQAMVESEYHDCPEGIDHQNAPVGLFQFSRRTAALYGMKPADYCDLQKQCDGAARHMSDLISDFGTEKSSWTLALLSFNQGAEGVREYLRQLRARGITERSYWTIFRHQAELAEPMNEEANRYVPRFFAAAIIGETSAVFDLSTPPLTALRR